MSDFELRRRLQGLKVDRHPSKDLWPAIAARLEVPAWRPERPARHVMLPWAAVAAVALTVAAGVWFTGHLGAMLGVHQAQPIAAAPAEAPDAAPVAASVPAPPAAAMLLRGEAHALQASYDAALATMSAERPRRVVRDESPELAAAARELDAATAQLNAALAAEPDATYLVELLKRTHERRVALAKLGLHSA